MSRDERSDEASEVIRAHKAGAPTDTQLLAFVREIVDLRAALAAAREDNERLRDANERLTRAKKSIRQIAVDRGAIMWATEGKLAAARVEVTQLQAENARLRKLAARAPRLYADNFHEFDPYERKKPDHPEGVFCKRCGNTEGNVYHDLDLRSVAEPLGSTPDQPATEENR